MGSGRNYAMTSIPLPLTIPPAGKMAVLISHRFSTVRMADRILVLEDGKIAEQGNHDDLIARGGRYSEMFELQAASYR